MTDFAALTKYHRINVFAMEKRKRAILALGSFLREQLGWRRDLPAAERKTIADRAASMIDAGEKLVAGSKRAKTPDDPAWPEWAPLVLSTWQSLQPFVLQEKAAAKHMEEIAATMPAASWWRETVFKDGLISLARIIAETGDLNSPARATVSKVWKRMGLAVIDGVRQGGLAKGAKAEQWVAHGYSPRRRALMFVIGDSLVKKQGHYREVYLAEKQRQVVLAELKGFKVLPAAQAKKGGMSLMHVHRRAQRYMEKQLLADLWSAWRQQTSQTKMPMIAKSADAERSAA